VVVLSGLSKTFCTENCASLVVRSRPFRTFCDLLDRELCKFCCTWSSFPDTSKTCYTENCASFVVRGRPFRTFCGSLYGEFVPDCCTWSSFPALLRLAIRRIMQVLLYVVVLSGLSETCCTENCTRSVVRGRPFQTFCDLLYRELCKFCCSWSSFPDFVGFAVQRITQGLREEQREASWLYRSIIERCYKRKEALHMAVVCCLCKTLFVVA